VDGRTFAAPATPLPERTLVARTIQIPATAIPRSSDA
jgi:hypothetical protein